ncbi:UNVERIFIED_CONTAM: hypothetical protein FKN15_027977 [Acipenser sinensis]
MAATKEDRLRNQRFSDNKLNVLAEEVVRNYGRLFGAESARTATSVKRTIWQNITNKINALGVCERSVDVVKKCWTDAKRRTKEKCAPNRAAASSTGGGPLQQLTSYETLIVTILQPQLVGGSLRSLSTKVCLLLCSQHNMTF